MPPDSKESEWNTLREGARIKRRMWYYGYDNREKCDSCQQFLGLPINCESKTKAMKDIIIYGEI